MMEGFIATAGDHSLRIYGLTPGLFMDTDGVSNITYRAGVITFTIVDVAEFEGDGSIRFYVESGGPLYHIDLV